MEQEFNHYDYLRYELFEKLFPQMLYHGSTQEQEDFFNYLRQDRNNLVHLLFDELCQEDHVPYPYEENDFEVRTFNRGGVGMIQITMPQYKTGFSDILRAYLLFSEYKDEIKEKKYFLIRRFQDGQIYILYIPPNADGLLGEELTEHKGDMEYEYWRLVYTYCLIIMQEMDAEQHQDSQSKNLLQQSMHLE